MGPHISNLNENKNIVSNSARRLEVPTYSLLSTLKLLLLTFGVGFKELHQLYIRKQDF